MGRHQKTTSSQLERRRPDRIRSSRPLPADPPFDRDLVELVDAVVSAVDTDRSWEVERVAAALEPFGAAALFGDELRLNGTGSAECPCRAEGWL